MLTTCFGFNLTLSIVGANNLLDLGPISWNCDYWLLLSSWRVISVCSLVCVPKRHLMNRYWLLIILMIELSKFWWVSHKTFLDRSLLMKNHTHHIVFNRTFSKYSCEDTSRKWAYHFEIYLDLKWTIYRLTVKLRMTTTNRLMFVFFGNIQTISTINNQLLSWQHSPSYSKIIWWMSFLIKC